MQQLRSGIFYCAEGVEDAPIAHKFRHEFAGSSQWTLKVAKISANTLSR